MSVRYDQPQGAAAIHAAAVDSVVSYLAQFQWSAQRDELWENHPLLLEREANSAAVAADNIAQQVIDILTYGKQHAS